jgi:hypothetical protein
LNFFPNSNYPKAARRDESELRTFDDLGNEDEFFLISTPATFDRSTFVKSSDSQAGEDGDTNGTDEEDEEDAEDEDEDEVEEFNTHVQPKPINMLRYQVQYELNRLSNIIEEEDFNYEEEDRQGDEEKQVGMLFFVVLYFFFGSNFF